MESAIPDHLKCPRSRTRRIADDYVPAFPLWSARTDDQVRQVVMAYFGVQARDDRARGHGAFKAMIACLGGQDGPGHQDHFHYVDAEGYDNWIAAAYWLDPAVFERWNARANVKGWWESPDRLNDGVGYFREIMQPRMEQFETAYSSPEHLEGVGLIMKGVSGEVQEHGYWGAMRDRIPLSQTDIMNPAGQLDVLSGAVAEGGRVRIRGHENLTVIRSGQDWMSSQGAELGTYLDEMEPSLRAGMDFLRDEGAPVGCYCNRYVRHIDADGNPINKSFGFSYWRSLAHLERWAESHPAHLSIFITFLRVVPQLENLHLYHEVSVFDADAQTYEYINCHPRTGLLRDAQGSG